jgi:hypothetical protein
MTKKRSQGTIFIVIGVILAYFSVFSYFLLDSIGAWWLVEVDPILGTTQTAYLNAFGYVGQTGEELEFILGPLGIVGIVAFLLGPILALLCSSKKNKLWGYLGLFLMIGSIAIFMYSLANVEDYESILQDLSFITGDEYIVYFGNVDLGLLGIWTWMLGPGFYIAIGGIVFILIGVIKTRS